MTGSAQRLAILVKSCSTRASSNAARPGAFCTPPALETWAPSSSPTTLNPFFFVLGVFVCSTSGPAAVQIDQFLELRASDRTGLPPLLATVLKKDERRNAADVEAQRSLLIAIRVELSD